MARRNLRLLLLLVAATGVAPSANGGCAGEWPDAGGNPRRVRERRELRRLGRVSGLERGTPRRGARHRHGNIRGVQQRASGPRRSAAPGRVPGPGPPPHLNGCNNIPPNTPYFDVHGKGTYMTTDGSVLYLGLPRAVAEPVHLRVGAPPFVLHDCGDLNVDPNLSTGIFHGATGNGTITADVPVRADFSAPVSADYIGTITLVDGATSPIEARQRELHRSDDGADHRRRHRAERRELRPRRRLGERQRDREQGRLLAMTNSVVGGNADCIGCGGTNMANSTVLGNFSQIGSPAGSSIMSNFVTGNLSVLNSGPGTFTIGSNIVNGEPDLHRQQGLLDDHVQHRRRDPQLHGQQPGGHEQRELRPRSRRGSAPPDARVQRTAS